MSQLLQVPAKGGLNVLDGSLAPAFFDQGLPYENVDNLAVDLSNPVDHWHQGLPFTAAGRLAVTQNAPAYYGSGAAPFSASKLCMLDAPVTDYLPGGVGITSTGQVAAAGLNPDGVFIITQPNDWTGTEGDTATFTVEATSGDGSSLTYQWEEFITGSWTTMTDSPPPRPSGSNQSGTSAGNVASSTLTITNVQFGDNGAQFRCRINNSQGDRFTVTVTLTVTGGTFFVTTEDGDLVITQIVTDTEEVITEDST